MTARERRWLVAVIAFGIGLRLILAGVAMLVRQEAAAFHVPDSGRYLALARSIVEHGTFRLDGTPELFRLPGFPLLVAIGVATGAPTAVTVVLQAAIGGITAWLCFVAGRQAGGTRTGLWAATLFALEPGQWAWSNLLVTETLFTALVAASLAASAIHLATGRGVWLMAGTGAAALSAYVRLIGYVLPFGLLITMAWIGRRATEPQRRGQVGRRVAAGLALTLALLGGWHVRNGLVGGYWGFSMQVDRAAYLVGRGTVAARQAGGSYVETVEAMGGGQDNGGLAVVDGLSPTEMRERGMRAIISHPWAFASTYVAGIGTTLVHPGTAALMRPFVDGTAEWDGAQPSASQLLTLGQWERARTILRGKSITHLTLSTALVVIAVIYLGLALTGLRRGWAQPQVMLTATTLACLLIVSGGPDGDSRRRAPLIPALSVLAAVVLAGRQQEYPPRRVGRLADRKRARPPFTSTGTAP